MEAEKMREKQKINLGDFGSSYLTEGNETNVWEREGGREKSRTSRVLLLVWLAGFIYLYVSERARATAWHVSTSIGLRHSGCNHESMIPSKKKKKPWVHDLTTWLGQVSHSSKEKVWKFKCLELPNYPHPPRCFVL